MTHAEIRMVKHLAALARELKRGRSNWASQDWTAFQKIMLQHPKPNGPEFEMSERQFTRCLRHAFVEVNYRP
jgi:hypothetical protein